MGPQQYDDLKYSIERHMNAKFIRMNITTHKGILDFLWTFSNHKCSFSYNTKWTYINIAYLFLFVLGFVCKPSIYFICR